MTEWITTTHANVTLALDPQTLTLRITTDAGTWTSAQPPRVQTAEGDVPFTSAAKITHHAWNTGLGCGIRSCYDRLPGLGGMRFETIAWIEGATGQVVFEFIPLAEACNVKVLNVWYPAAFTLEGADAYTVLPYMQGVLLPNDWDKAFPEIPFGGQLCSESAYMPWWGQVRADGGYIAIVETPEDARFGIEHPVGGPSTVGVGWLPSLGEMRHKRIVRFVYRAHCDYNDLCGIYRMYAREHGLLVTLAEKAARVPSVDSLIGCGVLHMGIKSHTEPTSRYYDAEHPERNDSLHTFAERAQQLRQLHDAGLDRAYLHLDGWGQPGYDNRHPDYLPACAEAGGWEGMRALRDTCAELGYPFGIHDQYRDYYINAETYDPDMAVWLADGTRYEHAVWAGGTQSYLCPSQQPMYVRRNFEEILRHVPLDLTYLDVFTCNEPDECAHPWHRVTRKECLEYRSLCFSYLLSRGILTSSEEVIDWAMPSLVFCHHAPYGKADAGIPVPLLNLVYHDCVIIPWALGHGAWGIPEGQLGLLHALLNGGIGYVDVGAEDVSPSIAATKVVGELHSRIAKQPMTKHEFLNAERTRQRSTFGDGTTVTVDFQAETYEIVPGDA